MGKIQHPMHALSDYLPAGTFDLVIGFIQQHKVHLTITKERKSVLGDYRNAHENKNHRITVNGNLNRYSFLITLLHELAHLLTYEQYAHRVQSHGKEWKQIFGHLLSQFVAQPIFPDDIKKELALSLKNPAASSCAEEGLMRVLRKYDQRADGMVLVEDVPLHAIFILKDGRTFKKGERLRKRYRCEEVATKKVYLFSPIYEVEIVQQSSAA